MTTPNELLHRQERNRVWSITWVHPRPEVSHRIDQNGRLRILLTWDELTIELFDDTAATLARCILDELEGADHDAR